MRFSFRPPNADYLGFPATPDGILRTAVRAESLGFDTLLVNDHVIVGPEMAELWGNTFDPLVTLSFLAAHTKQIRLATSVLIIPYRNPIITAKMVATLDQLSGGRVTLGVGAGWTEAEFAALSVSYADRGAATDEYLAVCQACWAPDPVTFTGERYQFESMHCSPKPVQTPHPPIWVGGSSNPALRRAAKFAEVWQPVPMALDALVERKAFLRSACDKVGREEAPRIRMSFRVNFTDITGHGGTDANGARLRGHGQPAEVAGDMRRYCEEAGLDEFQINFNGCGSLEQLEQSMDVFMQEVRPLIA